MAGLFNALLNEGLLNKWATLLDWLFDENRFDMEAGWSSGYVGSFTKKVKRLPYIGNDAYVYDSAKNINFPKSCPEGLMIIHARGDGEARDLIRHIRNGVAHGRTRVLKPKGELYIEILDYSQGKQTAYMFLPVSTILEIHNLYLETEKIKNGEIGKRGHTHGNY